MRFLYGLLDGILVFAVLQSVLDGAHAFHDGNLGMCLYEVISGLVIIAYREFRLKNRMKT